MSEASPDGVLPLHDAQSNGTNGHTQPGTGVRGRLQDKVAIVTGSSSGLGRAIALAFAAEGAKVVCSDMVESSKIPSPDHDGKPTHAAINTITNSTNAVFVRTDTSDSSSVANVVQSAVDTFGRLDIMVNNAGIAAEANHPRALRIHETPDETFDLTMRINSRGVWLGCKYATAQMIKQSPHSSGDRGWIINTSSILGLVGFPGTSSYCAAKGSVVQITKQVAVDYAKDRIHCNALNPGFTRTPMIKNFLAVEEVGKSIEALHPWGRLGEAEDIARAAVFLASGDASWVTGITMPVDGGYTAQ